MSIIGATATYTGTFHRWMRGHTVKVIGVTRGGDDGDYLTDDADLGGSLRDDDIVEVQPWVEQEGRFSFVASDASPDELRFG